MLGCGHLDACSRKDNAYPHRMNVSSSDHIRSILRASEPNGASNPVMMSVGHKGTSGEQRRGRVD